MLIVRGNLFSGCSGVLNPVRSAVIGNAVVVGNRVLLHNCLVPIGVVDDALVHTHDCGVVGKLVAAPLPA